VPLAAAASSSERSWLQKILAAKDPGCESSRLHKILATQVPGFGKPFPSGLAEAGVFSRTLGPSPTARACGEGGGEVRNGGRGATGAAVQHVVALLLLLRCCCRCAGEGEGEAKAEGRSAARCHRAADLPPGC
jgi:hypothetical protein